MHKPSSNGINVKFLVTLAALIVIFAGIHAAQTLIAPFLLALFFALILTPPLRWLKQKGMPEFPAIFTLSTFVFLMGFCVVLIFSNSLARFAERLPEYAERATVAYSTVDTWINDVADRFHHFGGAISPLSLLEAEPIDEDADEANEHTTNGDNGTSICESLCPPCPLWLEFTTEDTEITKEAQREAITEEDDRVRLSLRRVITLDTLLSYVQLGVNALLNVVTMGMLVVILLVFKLIEAARMPNKVKEAFGDRDLSNEYFKKIADDTWNYIKIKTIICFLTGLTTTIGLWVLGLEYAILWGLLMFFFNYIPNIGQVIASIPPILLALLDGGISLGIWVTIWLILVNCFFGLVIEPRYMEQGLGISSLVVMLGLVFWGWLLGPIGMFLSAPLTIVVKIVLQNDEKTRWIAVLLSNR
jgi:predicted PurR-regulated permease PerM